MVNTLYDGPASLSLDSSRAQQRSPMILKLLLKKRLRDKRREIQQRNSTINRVCPSQVETQSTHAGGEEKEVNAWVRAEASTGSEFLSLLRISEFFRFI